MSNCTNCFGCGEVIVEYKEKIYNINGEVIKEEKHIKWEICPVCLGKKEI